MPFFSVVIPIYNKENYIYETIQSILHQNFTDYEVILVNDGSTDKSIEVITPLLDDRFTILHQENLGASTARNNGVKNAKAEWIALLDGDDIWEKNHLEKLLLGIIKLKDVDVISTGYCIRLNSTYLKYPKYSKKPPSGVSYIKDYFAYSLIDPLFWTSTLAFKKKCFMEQKGFDPNLKTGQDLDLIIRFALKYKLGYIPTITLTYNRFTENNLSLAKSLSEKKKYIDKHSDTATSHQNLKKYLDINRYSLVLQAKLKKEKNLCKTLRREILADNLSLKQKLLLKLPPSILRLLKKLQVKLIKKGIYKSAFS